MNDFTERLSASFTRVFGELLPALLGALVILFAGYLLARLLEKGVERVLRKIRLNQLLARGGVLEAVERTGSHANPTRVVANLVFWLVMFAVLLVATNALGLQSLANVFSELVGYIPSVIAAIVIILVAVFMALQELGIATDIVTTAFAILFGAIALAMALAFGLRNRELAGEVTREWYERWRRERETALARERAAEAAEEAELAEEMYGPPEGESEEAEDELREELDVPS